jgi:hypothetical protein
MADETAKRIVKRYEQLKNKRSALHSIYDILAKYLLMQPTLFSQAETNNGPKFSVADVADDSAIDASRTAATALSGALWPHASQSFELLPRAPYSAVDTGASKSDVVRRYWASATRLAREYFDKPLTGMSVAVSEYFDDIPIFGTQGIYGTHQDGNRDVPFTFRSVSVQQALIDEGGNGLVDTVYLEYTYTVRQLVQLYGESVTEEVQKLYDKGEYDTTRKVVHAMQRRDKPKKTGENKDKLWESVHVDVASVHTLRESGMDALPAWVTRYRKRPGEVYGRSMAMDAMPTIRSLNVLKFMFDKAEAKILDPPIGYYQEVFGNGRPNLTAGAKVPLYASGKIPQGTKPVENLMQLVEPQAAAQRIEKMEANLREKFQVDKLLDFNNRTRMTARETDYRYEFRNQALINIFVRQIVELFYPMITWGVDILWNDGLLGLRPDDPMIDILREQGLEPLIIPQEVLDLADSGTPPYTLKFISPAARALKLEAIAGQDDLLDFATRIAQTGRIDALDNIDVDDMMRSRQEINGAPVTNLLGKDKVEQMRKAKQDALADQAELRQTNEMADVAAKGARAMKDAGMQ